MQVNTPPFLRGTSCRQSQLYAQHPLPYCHAPIALPQLCRTFAADFQTDTRESSTAKCAIRQRRQVTISIDKPNN